MKGFRPGIRVGVGWGKSRFQRWEDTRPLDKSYGCVSKLGDFSPIDMAIWHFFFHNANDAQPVFVHNLQRKPWTLRMISQTLFKNVTQDEPLVALIRAQSNECHKMDPPEWNQGVVNPELTFLVFIQVARLKIVLSKRSSRLVCVDRQWTWTKSTEPLENHLLIGYPKRISVWVASTGDANELNSF